MLDNQQTPDLAPNANDGTIDGAVAALANIDLDNLIDFDEAANRDAGLPPPEQMARFREGQQPRDPATQQFKSPKDLPPNHNQRPAEAEAAAAEDEPEDDGAFDPSGEFLEFPSDEDGGEPERIPVAEVANWRTELHQLRHELENARRVAPPPVEWDRQMYETVRARGELVQALEMVSHTILPPQPDNRLIDPNSQMYDPGAYHHQVMVYQDAQQRLMQVQAARNQQAQQLQREQAALREAARIREQNRLRELWPEIVSPAVQRQVVDNAARHYGITKSDFDSTLDSRMYAILKDALAFRELESQRRQAVQVVRKAPKLVRSQGRTNQNKSQANYSTAMRRLQQSGSIEDAANAIGGLLG